MNYKIKTILFFLLGISSLKAQVVFEVVSNPCNPASEQGYPMQYIQYLDIPIDWSVPDMNLNSSAIQAELVFADDGTTPGVFVTLGTPSISLETTTNGCDSTTWVQDLTGKIAVMWRGDCQFGLKAFNAQKRGAIGIIIINHTGAAMGMAGSDYGINVTIPVISIGRQDGEDLMTCISGGGVVGFIGNHNGSHQNNMSSSIADILMPESLAMPWDLAQNGIEFPVDFGMWAYNKGIDPQNNVTVSVDVTCGGTSVYSQASAPVNFAAPDTTYLDSNYFDLGTYAPSLWNVGTYTVSYNINNSNDENLLDNFFTYEFKLTNNEDIYSKGRLDSLNNPIHNLSSGPLVLFCGEEKFENCIVFKNEYAGTRNAVAKGLTFSSKSYFASIENKISEIRAYQWNDVFTDINSITFNNLSLIDSVIYVYPDNSLNDLNLYLPFNTPIALQDNQRYLFCVRNPIDSLTTGFDYNFIDYTATVNHYLQPISPVQIIDNMCGSYWYKDFGLYVTPAISITMDISTAVNEVSTTSNISPFPNPASNLLTIPLRKASRGNVKIEVFNLLGKLVVSETQLLNNQPLKLNVASIKNGQYLFRLTFSDGSNDVFKISVSR